MFVCITRINKNFEAEGVGGREIRWKIYTLIRFPPDYMHRILKRRSQFVSNERYYPPSERLSQRCFQSTLPFATTKPHRFSFAFNPLNTYRVYTYAEYTPFVPRVRNEHEDFSNLFFFFYVFTRGPVHS